MTLRFWKQLPEAYRTILICVVLAAATFATFGQVWDFEFTNYDEFFMIVNNPVVSAGLTLPGFLWALTTSWFDFWRPLTWLSHMLDCELFGLNAGGHHLVNVGFHAANTILLFAVLRRATGYWMRSAIVAAFFALHPLHVESVAWVAERKDVLSGFFFLLTLWAYERFVEQVRVQKLESRQTSRHSPSVLYILALVFFSFGLMSKPMLVTTPFVLLLLDFWPLRRWTGASDTGVAAPIPAQPISGRHTLLALVREKVPFFALSLVSCIITYSGMRKGHKVLSSETISWSFRVLNVPISYVRYLWKTVWPMNLISVYPLPAEWTLWQGAGAAFLLLLISIVVVLRWRRAPYLPFGWFIFLGTLLPVVGIVAMSYQSIADRYMYLPSIGLFIAVVWLIADFVAGRKFITLAVSTAAAIALLFCAWLTWLQVGYWRNSFTLWRHCLLVDPANVVAHYNLGCTFQQSGKMAEALEEFEKTVRLEPGDPEGNLNLGAALMTFNRIQEATNYFARAVKLRPGLANAHVNMGRALRELGDYRGAIIHDAEAIRLDARPASPYLDMARSLSAQGKSEEALLYYAEALKRNPALSEAHYFMGVEWMTKGMYGPAVSSFTEAVRLDPRWTEAQTQLARAAECRQTSDAINRYRQTLQSEPDSTEALNNLAWILATHSESRLRDGAEAVRLAERACDRSHWKETMFIGTLAAAYAEAGQFEKAVATAQRACEVASASGQTNLLVRNQELLRQYQDHKPWHQ